MCFKSRVKREGMIDGDRGGDDSVELTCVVYLSRFVAESDEQTNLTGIIL